MAWSLEPCDDIFIFATETGMYCGECGKVWNNAGILVN